MSSTTQQVVVHQQSTSGLAIAGLVFSILGWFTCGLLCIPGAFLCFLALFSTGTKGTAIAGLIVGFPGVLFFAFVGLGLIMGILGLGAAADSMVAEAERQRTAAKAQVNLEGEQLDVASDRIDEEFSLSNPSVDGFDDYTARVQNVEGILLCQVTFNSLPETAETAEAVVRKTVEELVIQDDRQEILAMAFDASGETLPTLHYGGELVYKPSDGQILTMDERNGITLAEADRDQYLLRMETSRTAKGITPERTWYTVSIVFADYPTDGEVREAVTNEIARLKSSKLDVDLSVYVGDKANKITWRQVQAPNGDFMTVDYVAASGKTTPNWDWGEKPRATEERDSSRTWSDNTGKFSVQAVFVRFDNGSVTIKRDDNAKEITVPMDRLSAESRRYVESILMQP